MRDLGGELARQPHVVRIEESDQVAAAFGDTPIAGRSWSAVCLSDDANTAVTCRFRDPRAIVSDRREHETIHWHYQFDPDSFPPGSMDDHVAIGGEYFDLLDTRPDILNHNVETVPALYRRIRPGADYRHSLALLSEAKRLDPSLFTKCGIMVGLGETDEEILAVMRDLRAHGVDMLTIGQYLQPSPHHLPVERYVHPDMFSQFEQEAVKLGFKHAAVGALVRSSYHADRQALDAGVA